MCGVNGLFDYKNNEPISRDLLTRMTSLMAHRGPDGDGFYFDDSAGVGLGHRRLSIIDLSTGDQPMTNEDDSIWIVFNGEIYNYKDIRRDLEAKGHQFRTSSDTEVILHAYEEYGVDCPAHFNGIFAFGLWDSQKRRLFLARDHFGILPLYYTSEGGMFRFASEVKAILGDPDYPRELDLDALNFTLTLRYCPAPWTLFKGVYKIPPSGYLVVDENGVHEGTYWDYTPTIDRAKTEEDWIAELREIYDQAIHRQMVADVPIGISLSGGVDSTTVLHLMAKHSSGPVKAYTVGFEGREDVNEVEPSRAMAKHYGAEFNSRIITEKDYADFMTRYIWHMEEPVVNQSAAAYYFVAQMARDQGLKVLLNGQGPDEAFGGYPRHLGANYVERFRKYGAAYAARLAQPLAKKMPLSEQARRLNYALGAQDEADALLRVYSIMPESARNSLLGIETRRRINPQLSHDWARKQIARAPQDTTFMEKMLFVDARTDLAEELLLSENKMSMAASIEARVPYLDIEIMKVAERIPGNLKINGREQKIIHKKVCMSYIPPEVANRKKIGFTSAADLWFRGKIGTQFLEQIADPNSFTQTYLNREGVEHLIQQHLSGRWDHQRVLFMLYSLENWYRVFMERITEDVYS